VEPSKEAAEREVDEPDGVPAEERCFLPLLLGLGALLGLQDVDGLPRGLHPLLMPPA
jgi:hypothetical protein